MSAKEGNRRVALSSTEMCRCTEHLQLGTVNVFSGADGSEASRNNKQPEGLACLTVPRAVLGKYL